MFVDRIKVLVQAGNGGRGAVSFRREKFVPKGGPDGGDGGRGGDVILRADSHTDNLTSLFYEPIIKAKNGGHGMGKKMYGRAAPNKVVKVPVGTVVYEVGNADGGLQSEGDGEQRPTLSVQRPTLNVEGEEERRTSNRASGKRCETALSQEGEHHEGRGNVEHRTSKSEQLKIEKRKSKIPGEAIADLARDGQEFVICQGGGGGKGNVHFKSSRNRAPRQYTEGEEGEQGHFLFELRTIADAGLVGYPNAGKSTLLRKLSAARPKVAPYPFTTLHPIVGVLEFAEYRRVAVADIPGLIEGAHKNVGLGHDFLRHITRCRILIFVVDTAGSEARSPIEDLQQLRKEIDLYDARLSARPWFIVANKMDLPEAEENVDEIRRRFPKIDVVPVSAANGEGIDALKAKLEAMLLGDGDGERSTLNVEFGTRAKV